jgi:hypothetical protein
MHTSRCGETAGEGGSIAVLIPLESDNATVLILGFQGTPLRFDVDTKRNESGCCYEVGGYISIILVNTDKCFSLQLLK